MRKKGTANKKQSKFVNYMLSPIRILKKAMELYMKGMQDCAGGLGYGGVEGYSSLQISHLPLSLIDRGKPSRASGSGNYEQLLIKMQRKDIYGGNQRTLGLYRQKQPNGGYDYRMRKSYSVGLGKMERIDEDKPCYFEEDQLDMKTRVLLYPRRRNYVGSK